MYASYSPTRANEFPNDNPALHEGARWICRGPLEAPRALLQAPPALPSRVERAAELPAQAARAAVPEERPAASVPSSPSTARVATRPEERALSAAELAARCAGPLQLDLTRIVLPHRVADIPPPPDFIFRPLAAPRSAASIALGRFEPSAAPPLTLLGYRVIDARAATSRVERRWRIDIAPCVQVEAAPPPLAPPIELSPPALAAANELPQPAAVAGTELESLAQALFPEAPMAAEPAILEPLVPPGSEPSLEPASSELAALGLAAAILEPPPASEARPSQKKQQRRRAARVASSATLAVAASAGNAELTRALEEIETAFAERRSEQPRAARNRQARRAGPKAVTPKAAPTKTGAAKAPKGSMRKAAVKTPPPDADEAAPRRAANAV